MDKHTTTTGKAAEAYVWMRLLEHGMVPCIPMVDCDGFDALVRLIDGQCLRVQVKSRGEPLPSTGAYGEQVKSLWWDEREKSLAFEYLVIVLPLQSTGGYEAWIVPADVVRSRLSDRGDLTPSGKLLREEWAKYRESWNLSGAVGC